MIDDLTLNESVRFLDRLREWGMTSLPVILITLVLGWAASRLIGFFVSRVQKLMLKQVQWAHCRSPGESEKRIQTLTSILQSTLAAVLWAVVAMSVLRRLGIDIAPLIAGAGIAGLAVGFGAQELVRDMISGFFMLLEDQIRTGDVAVINGTSGMVESITFRTTVLRDVAGTVHVYQNGKINTMSNMTKDWGGSVHDVGVAYKEDTDSVSALMQQVADRMAMEPQWQGKITGPFEVMGVESFGDSAVVIRGRFRTPPGEQWLVGREYRARLKKAFEREGIEIPFPHRTVVLQNGLNFNPQAREEPTDQE